MQKQQKNAAINSEETGQPDPVAPPSSAEAREDWEDEEDSTSRPTSHSANPDNSSAKTVSADITRDWVTEQLARNAEISLGQRATKVFIKLIPRDPSCGLKPIVREISIYSQNGAAATQALIPIGKSLAMFKGEREPIPERLEIRKTPEDFRKWARLANGIANRMEAEAKKRRTKMASKKQIDANRANAMRSTGPKTAKGKERVGGNAVTHRFFAKKHHLLWEDEDRLRADVFNQRQPKGAMEEEVAEQLITNLLILRQSDVAQKNHLADLAARAAAERVYEVEITGVEVGGKLHMFDDIKEQMLLEAGRNIELIEEDNQNAVKMSVTNPKAMKTTALIARQRQSAWRDVKRCDEKFDALQEVRRAREQKEEEERALEEFRKEAEEEMKKPPVRNPRRPIIAADGIG